MAVAGPRIIINNGILYTFDSSRGKMLSNTRQYIRAGINWNQVTDQFLATDGGLNTMMVGEPVLKDATIVSVWAAGGAASTWSLEVYKAGTPSPITSVSLTNEAEKLNSSINVDISAGDTIQLRAAGTNIPFPKCYIELAWRI